MASGRLWPGLFKSNAQKLALGIWPWTQGVKSRLPYHYKLRFVENHMKDPIPVHYRPPVKKHITDEYGVKLRVEVQAIPVVYPPESQLGLWGGEGFIVGYKRKKDKSIKPPAAKMLKPRLMNKILYSEILDRWMNITVTPRTLNLVDEAFGFDFYILKTHEVDLKSKLGMRLKREMLRALAKKSMYPDNAEKQNQIYNKYKEFIIPDEEIEWLGLSLHVAEMKQAAIEELVVENPTPLKHTYMEDLIQQLKENKFDDIEEESGSMFSSINPFKSS